MANVTPLALESGGSRHRPMLGTDVQTFFQAVPVVTRHNLPATTVVISTRNRIVHLVTGFTGSIALPSAASSLGWQVTISNHTAAARTITGGPVRSGAATTITSVPANAEYKMTSDGTEWFIIGN